MHNIINKYLLITIPMLFLTLMSMPVLAADSAPISPSNANLISGNPQQLPIPGMVTMVDIGAHECIPCKMMTPILEVLSERYQGRAAIAFIDVWKHQQEARKYGVRTIPTQIFYDKEGKEQFRHEGFLDQQSIVEKLKELGVQ